jgi:hypothetical protein
LGEVTVNLEVNAENLTPRILHACRTAGERGVNLMDIIGSSIPQHTGAAIIGGALFGLLSADLIRLDFKGKHYDSTNADKVLGPKGHRFHRRGDASPDDYAVGYQLADRLRGQESNVILRLGKNFTRVQGLLGFSLTEMMNRKAGAVFVNPVFSAPTKHGFDTFVIMPFAAEFRDTLDRAIKPACKKRSLRVGRGDDLFGSRHIISDIWSAIYNSRYIIADCTGKNANVFYELGIAHAVGKHAILVTQNKDDIPFDLQHWRYVVYEATPEGFDDLSAKLDGYLLESAGDLDADGLAAERRYAAVGDERDDLLRRCARYAAQGGLSAYAAALEEVLDYCDEHRIKIQPYRKRDQFFDFAPFLDDERVVKLASSPDHRTLLRPEEIFYAADGLVDMSIAIDLLDRILSTNRLVPGKEVVEYLVRHRRTYAIPTLARHAKNPDDDLRAVVGRALNDLSGGLDGDPES